MPKVLLVEDDDTMLSLLSMFLQFEGFEVGSLPNRDNLEDVLHTLHQFLPSVVLIDVHLRCFNGFDLLHKIRLDPALQQMRVVMSSGMDYCMEAYQQGADAFILKPYMPEELVKKIKQTLGE